jgi:fructose-bisphosphate aldolase class I
MTDLSRLTQALLADGKGLLAADETAATLTRRFVALDIESTPTSRRDYRELLLGTPNLDELISGVILQDETLRQRCASGTPVAELCEQRGLVVGIKVDAGARPLANHPKEHVTEGLDGLRDRLAEYRRLGAKFAKWRAVFVVTDELPSSGCIAANAHALGRYAALCQEQDLVPIVEPEVLMNGGHTIERCEAVTGLVLHAVFDALFAQRVRLEEMLLKPNMVLPGDDGERADVDEVAEVTLRCLRRHVPPAVPGIAFLSGGQRDVDATLHLDAINRAPGPKPWRLTFSYARALQDAAMAVWRGDPDNVSLAQDALYARARCNSLASRGEYTVEVEGRAKAAVTEWMIHPGP